MKVTGWKPTEGFGEEKTMVWVAAWLIASGAAASLPLLASKRPLPL